MKRTNSPFYARRTFILTLLSFVAVAALVTFGVSARRARSEAARVDALRAMNNKAAITHGNIGKRAVDKDPNAPLAPTVTATLTDNTATAVAPGSTINYTAVISNAGVSPADDAANLVFNGTLDANTTIVGGSVQASPVTLSDTLPVTVAGNVRIDTAAMTVPFSVSANDYQGLNGGALSISAFDATTTGGGQIVMTTSGVDIGKFTYNPAPGFTGSDTFTYTLTNSVGSSVGTVSITVSGMIWFINAAAGGGGDGRLTNPFNCYTGVGCFSAVAADDPGDNLFLYTGSYTGGNTLLANQRLIGQGAGASLSTITGITPPVGSNALPPTGGTRPSITTVVAATNAVNLGSGNTLRGFNIGNTTAADIAGTSFGTLTASEMDLTGTGAPLILTTGTLAATFDSLTATSAAGGPGIGLTTVGGTLTVSGTTSISGAGTQGISISGSSVAANFGTSTTVGSTTQGILVSTSTGNVSFGNTIVTAGSDGVSLQNNSGGTRSFGTLSTTNGSGVGFLHGLGGGLVTVSGATTITNPAGRCIDIQDSTTSITFANVNATQCGGTGVFLDDNTGAITFADLDIAPDANQRGFHATDQSTGVITTTSGTIPNTGTATAVEIVGTSAATRTPINMQWTSIAKNGGSNSGIILTNTSGTGFTINGTGVTVGSGGTLENIVGADAIALNTIGGLVTLKNMIIEDITAAGDATAANGTRSNVDAISGLTIEAGLTLDNCTIRRISDNAILGGTNGIPDVATVWTGLTINNCTIEDTNRFNVASHGDATSEGTVRILGIRGTVNVTNSLFQRGAEFLDFTVTAGTLTMTVTNSDFLFAYKEFVAGDLSPQASVGLHGIDVTVQGTSNAAVTIGDRANAALSCDFLNNRLASVRVANDVGATGNVDVTMGRNTFRSNDHSSGVACTPGCSTADFDFPMAGVLVMSRGADSATFDAIIDRNTFDEATNASGGVGQLTLDMSRGVWQVLAINNTFDTPGNAPWFMRAELNATTAKVKFQNNTGVGGFFTCSDASCGGGYNAPGLRALADVQNGGKLDLTIDNDTFAEHDAGFDPGQTFEGRALNVGAANALCMDLRNNNAPDGYGLEQFNASQTVNIFTAGGSGVCTAPGSPGNCQNALNANLNQGGTNNPNTVPPFVQVFGTVNVVGTACQSPSLAKAQPAGDRREYFAQLDNTTSRAPRGARTIEQPALTETEQANSINNPLPTLAQAQVSATAATAPVSTAPVQPLATNGSTEARRSHHAQFKRSQTVKARLADQQPQGPLSGEAVGPINIGTLPAGKSVTIKYSATVNAPPFAKQASMQGTVSGSNFANVPTNDPDTGAPNDATVTLINTLMTWNGVTSTDWNTATNWTPPAGGTQYAPGVSNPAINDVVIPNVGLQPNIGATDIGIFSLNISNGRTLTITSPRILTIGGSPGGDLTLDGIISGGELRLGTGTHVINNAGGTGSLSSTNVATVLSGSTVTLNNNLQAGALAVNAGGSMNITNRTLSLNGSGAALVIPGGATFTTTGSTIVFNGTAAQQAAGITYNNLTINNTIGAHVTGVTLQGNATVSGALTLTSSDLATGAFTLTMPVAATSGPASGATDVVGNVTRTGFVSGGGALSFGNPFNTIRINSGAAPANINVLLAKNAPVTYAAAVLRSYTITPSGASGPATLRLHYRQAELNGNNDLSIPNFNLRRGPNWGPAIVPTSRIVGVVEDNWLENNAVTTFSEWTMSNLAPTASGGAVTGRIVDDNGTPVEGAVVRLSGSQNRKFITDANGYYRFDNVETNGFYNVTPARVNYTFSPAVIAFSQIGESTNATFGASATGGNINPLDTPEYYVRQHYLDFLGREPEEAGFNFWSDQILGCGDDTDCVERRRTNVSAAYFLSIEFQETGGLVDGVYRASYGRRPSYGEFRPDAGAIGRGVIVGTDGWQGMLLANKAAFLDAFVQRAAFQAVYGGLSNDAYVDALIANTGVSFTTSERADLVSGLAGGDMTRATVLRAIAENGQFVAAKRNQAFVMMEYFGYLRREPDADGYQFWLHKLNEFNGNFEQAEMVKSFIISGEYRQRFPR